MAGKERVKKKSVASVILSCGAARAVILSEAKDLRS
jgi:hypothetical protein